MPRRTQTAGEKRKKRKRLEKLNEQKKLANFRAKFGPSMRPAPVIVRALDSGEVLRVCDQSRVSK